MVDTQTHVPAPRTGILGGTMEDLTFDEDRLRIYYAQAFPVKAMFNWLSYGNMAKKNMLSSLDD